MSSIRHPVTAPRRLVQLDIGRMFSNALRLQARRRLEQFKLDAVALCGDLLKVKGQTGESLQGGGFFSPFLGLVNGFLGRGLHYNENAFVSELGALVRIWGEDIFRVSEQLCRLHGLCVRAPNIYTVLFNPDQASGPVWARVRNRYRRWYDLKADLTLELQNEDRLEDLRDLREKIEFFTPQLSFCFSEEALEHAPDPWQHFLLLGVVHRAMIGQAQPGDYSVSELSGEGASVACQAVRSMRNFPRHASYDLLGWGVVEEIDQWEDEFNTLRQTTFAQANKALEYKFKITQYEKLEYEWNANAPLRYDFHGDPEDKDNYPKGYFESYANGTSDATKGKITIPYNGSHGWYWKNTSTKDITITLTTKGNYNIIGVIQ